MLARYVEIHYEKNSDKKAIKERHSKAKKKIVAKGVKVHKRKR